MKNTGSRLYFIDNLRGVIINLVIVLHTALCYMKYAPEWWYVLNPERSFIFTIMVILVDVFIMPIMFFCAGYFTFASLRKKGSLAFWKDKQMRVAIPWVLGVFLLAPPLAYLIYFTRNVPVSLGNFWLGDFLGKMFQQAHYWFLGVLLVFFGIANLLAKIIPEITKKEGAAKNPGIAVLGGFILFTTGAALAMNQFFPLDFWLNKLYIITFQPVRVIGLLAYFLLGIYAEKNNWFTEGGYRPGITIWSLIFVISAFGYVFHKIIGSNVNQTAILFQATNAFLFNVFCFSSLMAFLAVFQKAFNKNTPFWKNFSSCSYGIYYVHMFFVFGLAYFMIDIQISVFTKFIIVLTGTISLSWLTAIIIRKIYFLNEMF